VQVKVVRFGHACVAVIVLILLSTGASAIATLEILGLSCNADGTLTLLAKNPKDDPIFTDTITITAKHADDNQPRTILGAWDREWIAYDPVPEQGIARFQSESGMLDDAGDYQLWVAYRGCGDNARCKIAWRLQSCPGEKIRCEKDDVTSASCLIDDNMLYLYADAKPRLGIDVKKDLLFHFESSRRNLNGVHAFPGMIINMTEDGYLIKLALEEGEIISKAGIRDEACNKNSVMVACEDPSAEPIESTATIVDMSTTPDDDTPIGMESITGAVVGAEENKKRAFIFGWPLMVLLSIVVVGTVYLLYASNARQKKRQEYLRGKTREEEFLLADEQRGK